MLTDKQRADGWIEHDGGPCPVDPNSRPLVLFRDGFAVMNYDEAPFARSWDYGGRSIASWRHRSGPADIIAYRPAP